jgi:hypothetical protein
VDSERSEGRNFTEECAERTGALQTCMEAHREYYEDFLFDSEAAAAAATAALADGASGEAGADGGEAAAPQTPEQPDGGAAGEHGAGGSGGKGPEDAGGGRDEPKDTPDPESEGGAADGAHVLQLLPCVLCVLSGAASCSCMLPHTGAPLFLVRIFGGHPSCSRLRQRGSAQAHHGGPGGNTAGAATAVSVGSKAHRSMCSCRCAAAGAKQQRSRGKQGGRVDGRRIPGCRRAYEGSRRRAGRGV